MLSIARLGAGGFWTVEERFRRVRGVHPTTVGHSGGLLQYPLNPQVCSGGDGHAEVVQLRFKPEETTFEALLEVFWKCHDPTMDPGTRPYDEAQHRSAIFYHEAEQRRVSEASRRRLSRSGRFKRLIPTQIAPFRGSYRAGDYHQQYLD